MPKKVRVLLVVVRMGTIAFVRAVLTKYSRVALNLDSMLALLGVRNASIVSLVTRNSISTPVRVIIALAHRA